MVLLSSPSDSAWDDKLEIIATILLFNRIPTSIDIYVQILPNSEIPITPISASTQATQQQAVPWLWCWPSASMASN